MFKNGSFFRKKSDSSSLPDQPSVSTSFSFKNKATKLISRAYTSIAYSRWFGELPSLKDPNSLFWLLGNSYNASQKNDFRFDFASRIWISYRDEFPSLNEKNVRSDFGWGCTLRSAQMLIAQSLMLEKFGRGLFASFFNA